MIILRLINVRLPEVLEAYFQAMSIDTLTSIASTNYEKEDSVKEQKLSTIDKLLNIDPREFSPPPHFKKMGFSTLSIKSALPLVIYPFTVYLISLVLTMIKRKFGTKVYIKEKQQVVWLWKKRSSRRFHPLSILQDLVDFFYDTIVWNIFVKCNIFMLQKFAIAIFLNIRATNYSTTLQWISFIVSNLLIVLLLVNLIGLYLTLRWITGKIDTAEYQEFKIFNNLRKGSIFVTLLVLYKVIVSKIVMSICVTFLYWRPLVVSVVLLLIVFLEMVISIVVRPFNRKRDNFKMIFESFLFFFIHLGFLGFSFDIGSRIRGYIGIFVIAMITLLSGEGLIFRLAGYKGI